MKRSLKNLKGYSIETSDGTKGKVKDFLFDEEKWVIRYLEADFGNLFSAKRVLIPGNFIRQPDWDAKKFHLDVANDSLEKLPDLEEHLPVSREYEEKLSRHYGLEYYWSYAYTPAGAAMFFPRRPLKTPTRIISEKDVDTSLRSFKEIEGYQVKATDGTLGHIEDMIVDDEDWQIVYVIVDTKNWVPWSKKVLLPLEFLKDVSYVETQVSIDLPTDKIKNAPEYNTSHPVDMNLEKALYEFYKEVL